MPASAGPVTIAAVIPSHEWKPRRDCGLRLLGNLKLHGPLRFLLNDSSSVTYRTTGPQILDPQSDKIAGAELAVDGEVDERQLSDRSTHFKSDPD